MMLHFLTAFKKWNFHKYQTPFDSISPLNYPKYLLVLKHHWITWGQTKMTTISLIMTLISQRNCNNWDTPNQGEGNIDEEMPPPYPGLFGCGKNPHPFCGGGSGTWGNCHGTALAAALLPAQGTRKVPLNAAQIKSCAISSTKWHSSLLLLTPFQTHIKVKCGISLK